MATSVDFIDFVAEQVQKLNSSENIRYRKMFGEYMVYVDDKPILLVCDDIVYFKTLPELDELCEGMPKGFPYSGAKEHYILDVENIDKFHNIFEILISVIPVPKPRKKKIK